MSDGSLINNNNLTENQKRNGMFNFLKTETITSNKQPESIPHPNCPPTYNCEKKDMRDQRVYKASFRQPIRAVRKMTNCNKNNNEQCQTTTKLYKDHYSQNDNNTLASGCPNTNGTLPTGKLNNINLDENIVKSQSGITTRTSKPIIRSGMQPNTAGQQNSGLDSHVGSRKRSTYAYSFRELLNNRRKSTVEKSLAYVTTQGGQGLNNNGIPKKYGYGGQCASNASCANGRVIDRLNNKKFYKQGSVESSTRLERLKLETIRAQTRCATGTSQANNSNCSGDYFAGKPKYKDLNAIDKNTKILIKRNEQKHALLRARGSMVKKPITDFSKGGVCCDN
tara:strand:- start:1099 stop:2109 length:1011 start_codon:yes stop_codon:yes gene_type:complete